MLLLAIALLVWSSAVVAVRLVAASRISPQEVRDRFAGWRLNDCGSAAPQLQTAGDLVEIDVGYGRAVALAPHDGVFTILAVGASSLVLPSLEETFPAFLETTLQQRNAARVRVLNVGHAGATAARVCERGRVAAAIARPDLVVVYSGHNDFTGQFRNFREQGLLPVRAREWTSLGISDHWRVHLIEPTLARWLQAAGALRLDVELMQPLVERSIAQWQHGITPLLSELHTAGCPVLIVRPIGNLERPPVGFDAGARTEWHRAMAAGDIADRLRRLRRARDADAFNGDIRAKSAFGDALQRLAGEGVYYFDLEHAMEAAQFRFADGDFFDFVHPRPDTHRAIAAQIADYLLANRLCCSRAPDKDPPP